MKTVLLLDMLATTLKAGNTVHQRRVVKSPENRQRPPLDPSAVLSVDSYATRTSDSSGIVHSQSTVSDFASGREAPRRPAIWNLPIALAEMDSAPSLPQKRASASSPDLLQAANGAVVAAKQTAGPARTVKTNSQFNCDAQRRGNRGGAARRPGRAADDEPRRLHGLAALPWRLRLTDMLGRTVFLAWQQRIEPIVCWLASNEPKVPDHALSLETTPLKYTLRADMRQECRGLNPVPAFGLEAPPAGSPAGSCCEALIPVAWRNVVRDLGCQVDRRDRMEAHTRNHLVGTDRNNGEVDWRYRFASEHALNDGVDVFDPCH